MFRCIVCEKTEWENVDEFRLKPHGMEICKSCGFITYPQKLSEADPMRKKYYESDYRKPPTIANFYTCERKIHYHSSFLKDEIKKRGEEELNFLEIGAAFGVVGNWLKGKTKWKYSGTELTKSFRRVAMHDYGIKLDTDFDESKKYDYIMTYKVAEHQIAGS